MPSMTEDKPFLAAFRKKGPPKAGSRIPFWLMRQAGRYLPEYRDVRSRAGGFLDLVYNPELAAEVTLQPIRRFGMDAAILFSDILVVPHGLGRDLTFVENEGPKLNPLRHGSPLPVFSPNGFDAIAGKVYESVAAIRGKLAAVKFEKTALIGFAGAPWTVACYMVEGGGSRDFIEIKRWAYSNPESFGQLIDIVTEATIHYLRGQIAAGAEAVQLFDSWAGACDERLFRQWVITPTREIVEALRAEYPDIPIIGFPRGAGRLFQEYAQATGVSALSLDPQTPLKWAATLQQSIPIQGNLDPVCLLAGGEALDLALDNILMSLTEGPFIFNLGHGIHKDTPPAHVDRLSRKIRDWQA
jgi:uroporphyrinogen decarboxylase